MGEFFKEHLESIMMISFLVASALGMYKVYVMFESQADDGIDIKTLEDEIIAIIKDLISKEDISKRELLSKIEEDRSFDKDRYSNLNENRLNQILDRLYTEYKIESYDELVKKIKER
ncbi:hypothetical protein MNB_SM-7-189 [hydrothermal vent metagenome]|uniref:Uncharacterized protein n=1 Tax=hydrothermal vent metagenome TaxID=652676 RepID=A0A1W1BZQ1_9ZZZZ